MRGILQVQDSRKDKRMRLGQKWVAVKCYIFHKKYWLLLVSLLLMEDLDA